MILISFCFSFMTSVALIPSTQEDSSLSKPLENASSLEMPLEEEIIEPFFLESDKEEENSQEGLQDTFDKGMPDAFKPKELKK